MQLTHILLVSLLATHRPPATIAQRLDARHDAIVQAATEASEQYHVPVSLLLAVGFCETHLGTDDNEGGNWGAPIDARHRHIAGTPANAARILARGFEVCGSWRQSAARFRSGACRGNRIGERYATMVMRVVRTMHEQAGMQLPDDLR